MNEDVMPRRHWIRNAALVAGGTMLAPPVFAAHSAGETPGVFDAHRFGAKGDGKHDDTAAIQGALNAAGMQGGIVFLSGGTYRLDGTLSVPQSVCLQGVFQSPPRTNVGSGGTILLAHAGRGQETGPAFITLHTNSTLKGLSVLYPEQSSDHQPYPPTVQGDGDDCSLVDVLLLNPYFGVDFGTHPCGRHWIKSLYMQALRRGLYVAECFDVGRIEDVHVWPFWRIGDKAIDEFTANNGEAFVLGRTDWEYMSNCFCIGYHTGYRFLASKSGAGNVVLTQCGSDEGPESTSVLVEASQGHAGVSFVNGQFMGRQHVQVNASNSGPVKFTACGFWGQPGQTGPMAVLQGTGQTSFQNCHFTGWAAASPAAPAIDAQAGGLSVQGCDFMAGGPNAVRLGPNTEAAALIGNRLRHNAQIVNDSPGDIALLGNVTR